ncbi:MAG: hypothetical protein WDK96_00875 [Candidatus Paceibacterota bacterium]|jgi:hypothetical protein
MENFAQEIPKFQNPNEEIAFLREQIAKKGRELKENNQEVNQEKIVKETINEYSAIAPEKVLPKEQIIQPKEVEGIVLKLKPETHDNMIEELFSIMLEKGVKNVLTVLENMRNPHLDDDFHRFLVQYLDYSKQISGLKENSELFKALHMKLFEITLPEKEINDNRGFKEMISVMEQFYSGMQSVADGRDNYGKNYFTLEIALSNVSDEVIFYASVPESKVDLFEKQLLGAFSKAKLKEITDDYNIFTNKGGDAGAYAKLSAIEAFPLKTYEKMEHDPMNSILNVFSKMKKEGEGAAIQIIFCPAGDTFIKRFNQVLSEVRDGKSAKKALELLSSFDKQFFDTAKKLFIGSSSKDEKKEKKVDDVAVTNITEKVRSTIVSANLRIIASAETKARADEILSDMESAFNQFSDPNSNSIVFEKTKDKKLLELFHDFSFRLYSEKESIPLNYKELTTIYHFPVGVSNSPQLKQSKSGIAPAPLDLPEEGVILGINKYRGVDKIIRTAKDDRVRHFYAIGQTGTGKTSLFKNMIIQDIENGEGCCFIDPHGSDIQDILGKIPANRIDDVIYFDPSYTPRPMGLNMLEFDPRYPEQKSLIVDELMGIFTKLFGGGADAGMGAMFEQYFRNSALLVMEDPESGCTLLEISRVLGDKEFRDLKLSKCKNPIITQFWQNAEQTSGDQSLANFVPYISSKFDVFISNEIMRPVVLQEHSTFNFRKIMDEKKILLVNLSKGRLGEINANLIGLVLVGKIQMAALSRADMYGKPMNDFYLYIDEFQNFSTPSIASILAEARKYRLSLNMAHQYISQLTDDIKGAVFGNVGSMAIFRVSSDDAKYLESRITPTFTADDITKLDNFNAYMSLLVRGQPTKPFNMELIPPQKGNLEMTDKIKELSYYKYGRDRGEVEEEIRARYNY